MRGPCVVMHGPGSPLKKIDTCTWCCLKVYVTVIAGPLILAVTPWPLRLLMFSPA